jgi:hypothetical protein
MIHTIIAAAVGFVVGAFTPAVGRKIKSWFVPESKVVVADVTKKL